MAHAQPRSKQLMRHSGNANAGYLPRKKEVGQLTLDLFHRDAKVEGRWLRLHPREFEVLWHLADASGEALGKRELLAEVWRIDCVPEGNRVEVTISRIRSKLSVFNLACMLVTDSKGGYRLQLDPPDRQPEKPNRVDEPLDSYLRIGNVAQSDN